MPQFDPNPVASGGADDVQGSINKLVAMKQQPGADIPGINTKIATLVQQQADLANQALQVIEASPANQQAITSINDAAARLKTEAAKIGNVATALNDAAKVITEATSLITTLAPFI
jgi:methyl-accepting chemotaxis protein